MYINSQKNLINYYNIIEDIENKYLKIVGDKFKKLKDKNDEDNKWNKLGNLALSNKDKLNRAKVNKDLVILSTPQLSNTRQTKNITKKTTVQDTICITVSGFILEITSKKLIGLIRNKQVTALNTKP